MIALTQEKREKLIADCRKSIALTNAYISIHGETPELKSNLQRQEIALESLTAEKSATVDHLGVIWNGWKPEVGTLLFTAPPVPEIKLPEIKSDYAENEEWVGCPVSYRRGKEDGHNALLEEIKRLNGLTQ